MMRGSRMLRRALILGGLCVVVAAVGSVGWAMTTANDKVIVACAKKKSGALRLVASAKNCRKTERAVTWNQEGLRGLPGPKGVAGEDGLDGENGIDGEDGVDGDDGDDGVDGIDGTDGTDATVTWKYVVTPGVMVANGTATISAGTCAAPTPNAVNGGVQLAGLPATVSVTATSRGTTASTWDVRLASTGAATVSTWVLCTNGTNLP
jgi:Collagen triple helix repeat (20 copies)